MAEAESRNEEFQSAVCHLDELVREFEAHPVPEVREKAMELLRAVDAVHRTGLERLVEFFQAQGYAGLVEQAAIDPVIRTLLLLYDLLPNDPFCQAVKTIQKIRAYIQSHGGDVEVVAVEDGVVRVRLSGACQGCPAAFMTLQAGIRSLLEKEMTGFRAVEVEEVTGGEQ